MLHVTKNSCHSAKRPRRNTSLTNGSLAQTLLEHHAFEQDDFWETARLFTVLDDDGQISNSSPATSHKRKRDEGSSDEVHSFTDGSQTSSVLEELWPGSAPSLPSPLDRVVDLAIPNPFIMGDLSEIPEHPRLTSIFDPVVVPKQVRVNGLVKFHLQFNDPNMPQSTKQVLTKYRKEYNDHLKTKVGEVSYLPPDFGRGLNLEAMDQRLFKFYVVAYCAGRTLLPASNVWLTGVPAIAAKSDCVKHAMLSCAAGYVLDYVPSDKLKQRASYHHKRAVMLLGLELGREENYEPGKEEPLLMALSLLNHEDIVNWETRESTKRSPKWYQGDLAVKYLLDSSDPGYRYKYPINVQSSKNRYVMSHYQMKSLILSDTCAPLMPDSIEGHPYSWLLEGNEKEVRRVTGLAGCSAKILHIFTQITRLCSQLQENPDSIPIKTAGKVILESLTNFQQWSDLMPQPFPTTEQLGQACEADKDEHGKVRTAALSVALNADSYVLAAQIYILCRLFRLPRRHPDVQSRLSTLVRWTDYLPLDGPLYTAQDSLYGLAISGFIAVEPGHRDVVVGQFCPLLMGPRGNDPPVWHVTEKLWSWLEEAGIEDDPDETDGKRLSERKPWWETMVAWIMETQGRLSLS
ncbi:hypothetical protein H2202_003313 [Exophiala xenobiotica]|nr:hypothetical protein H2202_003313 [Exophiala xenobiotica]KAK5210807.1 hypothetical protein LTR41_003419 [Exophiala xenobiotica]KAK5237261.1 hypothetical protein LTR47_001527 [Exophiala xenobiotica]KAK5249208.1 hypothetical protein LTS06_005862 [Exophiala xenobiotica]KAK5381556.1 hypothetical protein LTR11_003041 [Exophiala xenobiotica]